MGFVVLHVSVCMTLYVNTKYAKYQRASEGTEKPETHRTNRIAERKNGKMLLLYVLVFKLDFCIIKLDFVAVIKLLFLHSSALAM